MIEQRSRLRITGARVQDLLQGDSKVSESKRLFIAQSSY